MTELRTEFIKWYWNEFTATDCFAPREDELYQDMVNCKEDSPWHREESVAIHTNMVVSEYITRADYRVFFNDKAGTLTTFVWGRNELLGAFAAAFHDVGKPGARQRKWKKERGDYNSFNGHEQLSARLWEDWACRNWKMLQERFEFTVVDIYSVGFMVEYHKPWDIRKPEKRVQMALTLMKLDVFDTFIDLVKADTWGRISDDMDEKKAKVTFWCNKFREFKFSLNHQLEALGVDADKPILFVPVGASGSGKSTAWANAGLDGFSLDGLRLEFYGEPYEHAFQASIKDKEFRRRSQARFMEMIRAGHDLFLDATNTSKKTRRWYITEARRHGFTIVAILFPVAYKTIVERQETRTDKTVPEDAVYRQYYGIQLPQYGEFDSVVVDQSNLLNVE